MIQPLGPASAYKTYRISRPSATHWRDAKCEEVSCPNFTNGWRTKIDEASDLGKQQAQYIRKLCGRQFTEHREDSLTVFTFEAGQNCFQAHKAELGREPIYVVRDGDQRGNPRGTSPRIHKSGDDWVDDFATHQQTLVDEINKG